MERPPETIDQRRCLSVRRQRSSVIGQCQLDQSMTIAQLVVIQAELMDNTRRYTN